MSMVFANTAHGIGAFPRQHEAADAVAMRSLRHECVALVGRRLGQPAGVKFAIDGLENFGAGIERTQLRGERGGDAFAGDIGLGDHQAVREDRLLARLRRPAECIEPCLRIDHRHHRLDMKYASECAVGGESLQDRARIGEAAGLDDDAA